MLRKALALLVCLLTLSLIQAQRETLVIKDLFKANTEATSWSVSPPGASRAFLCKNANFWALGGIQRTTNRRVEFWKTFQIPAKHVSLEISVKAIGWRSVDGCSGSAGPDYFRVYVDGAEAYKRCDMNWQLGAKSYCNEYPEAPVLRDVQVDQTFRWAHTGSTVVIKLVSDANEMPENEAFGFANLVIRALDGPTDCDRAANFTHCAACDKTASLVNGRCVCPVGAATISLAPLKCTESCPVGCKKCNSAGQCIECNANAEIQGRTCECKNGYYAIATKPALLCDRCHGFCNSCKGPKASDCTSCFKNAQLIGSTCFCAPGFTQARIGSLECERCHESCETCFGLAENQCMKCKAGYSLANGRCFKCHGRCKTCNGPADTQCLSCPENAALLAFGSGQTKSCFCQERYFALHNQPLQCIPCADNCQSCEDPSTCTSCASGAVFQNLPTGRTCACPDGTYKTGSKPLACGRCHRNCKTCSGPNPNQCLSCNFAGQALQNGQCQSCHSVCLTCSGIGANQCLTCRAPSVFKSQNNLNTCDCPPGTYSDISGGVLNCRKCDPSCAQCTAKGPSQCSVCHPGAILKGKVCQCPDNQYISSLSPFKCSDCHKNCATCVGAGSNMCKTCAVGLSQVGRSCIQCDGACATCTNTSPNGCSSCGVGAVLTLVGFRGTGGKTCVCPSMHQPAPEFPPLKCVPFKCFETCTACKGPHRDQCTSCKVDHILEGGQCREKICDKTCLKCGNNPKQCTACNAGADLVRGTCQCKPGYFNDTAESCQQCDKSCVTCKTATECLTCPAGAVKGPNGLCACIAGYYKNPVAETLQCLKCQSKCVQCSSAQVCTACKPGEILTEGACAACNKNCLTCKDDPNNCDTCRNFAGLKEVAQPGNKVIKTCSCKEGFVEVVTRSGPECQACKAPCKTCSDTTTKGCLSCNSDAFFVIVGKGGECRCNAGLYLDGKGLCQKCNPSCVKCSGPTAGHCTECQKGLQLARGSCIKCHASCATCVGTAHTQCSTCPKNGRMIPVYTGNRRRRWVQYSYCACNGGFYQADGECLKCSSVCATCTGPNTNQCGSCGTNGVLVNHPTGGRTCQCRDGYYASSLDPFKCERCDSSCKTCSGPKSNECTSCSTSIVQSLVNGQCTKCDLTCLACTGTGPNACTKCAPNAEIISPTPENSTCQCKQGFYSLTKAPLRCQPYKCHASCLTCKGPQQYHCLTCPPSFELVDGFCKLPVCAPDCLRCKFGEKNTTICTQCADGAELVEGKCRCTKGTYPFGTKGLSCKKCPTGCTSCNAKAVCTSCEENAEPVNGQCKCKAGFFSLAESVFKCHRCHVSCATCKGYSQDSCLSCEKGQILANGRCVKCSPICATCNGEGDFKCTSAGPNAKLVDVTQGRTVECLQGFYSKTRDPFKCEKYACHESCAQCKGPDASHCTSCRVGQTLSNGNCIDVICNTNCKTCNPQKPDECKTCVEGAAVNAEKACECNDEHDISGFSPLKCHKYVCDRSCKTCTGTSSSDCKTCIDGASGPTNGTCTCKDGTFLTGNECKKCHSSCAKCTGQNYDECSGCKTGDIMIGKKCITCDASCKSCNAAGPNGCTACNGDQFVLKDVEGGKACKCKDGFTGPKCTDYKCHESCATCSGPSADQCKTCKAPLEIVNGKSCKKPSCHSSCADCIGARETECTVCPKGAAYNQLNGQSGVCQAGEGFYKETDKTGKVTFKPCDPTCKTCTGAGPAACSSCFSKGVIKDKQCVCENGYFLMKEPPFKCGLCNSKCKTCDGEATKCTSCPSGTQLGNGTCFSCNKACLSCSGSAANQCTKCTAQAMLVPGVGGGQTCQCNARTYIVSDNPLSCEQCHSSCNSCNGPSDSQCTTCVANAELKPIAGGTGHNCKCKEGYAAAPEPTLRCVETKCHSSCSKCSGPAENQCTSCPPGTKLSDGKCTKIQCHAKCATCDGTEEHQCLTCSGNAKLIDLKGGKTCQCLSGFFGTVNPTLSCSKCDGSCLTCEGNAANCTSCSGHGVAKNGKCGCPENEYQVTTNPFTCAACHTSCKGCTGSGPDKCIACAAGLQGNGSSCYKCHGNCETCSGPAENLCKTCPKNSALKNGTCACNAGFIPAVNSTTLKCEEYKCDETCTTCRGPHKNECLTCKAGLTKTIDGYCRQLTCHKSCVTCNGTTENDCLQCNTGANLDNSTGKSICKCRKGYYQLSPTPVYCKECDPSCADCSDALTCKECPENTVKNGAQCACKDGFYNTASQGKVICKKCEGNCTKCSGANQCTACPASLTLVNGQCITCHETCSTCRGPGPNDCLSCPGNSVLTDAAGGKTCKCAGGNFRDPKNATNCLKCHGSCVSCNAGEPNDCSKCDASAILKDGSCTCKEKEYKLATTPLTCGKCHSSCQTCKGEKETDCLTCVAGRKSVNGVCTICHQSCDTCSGPSANQCLTCRAGAELTSDKKCQCGAGSYQTSNDPLTCAKCHANCKTCGGSGEKNCTACGSSTQILSAGQCACREGFFVSATIPSLACTACDSICASCSGQGSNHCLSCKPGQTLASKTCITCDATCKTCTAEGPNGCETCPLNAELIEDGGKKWCKCKKGFASKFKVPLKCEPYQCHGSCTECTGPEPNQCTKCQPNLELDSSAGICKIKACSPNCLTCNPADVNKCLSCTAGASLDNGACKCKTGKFQAKESPLVCEDCHNSCVECSGAGKNQCKKCPENANLTSSAACECADGFFAGKELVFKCHRCHAQCATCTGYGQDQCKSCTSPRRLVNGRCVLCHPICANCNGETDTDCVAPAPTNAELVPKGTGLTARCKEGFASNTTAPLNCVAYTCHETCGKCSGPLSTQCTECKDTKANKLIDGKCIPRVCHPNCLTCEGETENDCLTCAAGAALAGNNATKSKCACTAGYLRTKVQPLSCEKIQCHRTCATCHGPSSSDCDTCSPDTLPAVNSTPTKCICKDGTFLGSNGCEKCHSSCTSCSGPNYNECTKCKNEEKLIDGKCIKCHDSCKDCTGTLENQCVACKDPKKVLTVVSGGKACQCPSGWTGSDCSVPKCESPCKECTGPNECKSCVDGFNLVGKACAKPNCHSTCQTCDGPEGAESACLSCVAGGDLQIVAGFTGKCVPKGGYFKKETNTDNKTVVTFEKCDASCKLCSGSHANECLGCFAGATLSTEKSCTCSSGTFQSSKNPFVCTQCHGSCSTCKGAGPNDCLTCINTLQRTDDGKCLRCDSACLECSAEGRSKCTKCAGGAQLTSVEGGFTCTCQIGTVGVGIAPLTCSACESTCKSCTSSNKCTGCGDGAVIKDGKCVCPEGLQQISSKPVTCAKACPQNCATCNGDKCLSCLGGFTLDGNNCVKSQCHKNCKTCSGPGENECATCPQWAELVEKDNGKTCSCKRGYATGEESGHMTCDRIKCDVSCKLCSKPNDASACIDCWRNAVLSPTGECSCPYPKWEEEPALCSETLIKYVEEFD